MKRVAAAFLLSLVATLGAASAVPPAPAATATVIYRCVTGSDAVTLQDAPCPKGQREERREIAAFATPGSPPTPSPADALPPDAEAAPAAPRIEEGVAQAPQRAVDPPPIWRCTNLNGESRLSDAFDPTPRCVPLSVLGIDLSRAPPAAATLCQTVEDSCVELRGDAACAAWEERRSAAESALLRAFSDTAAERRAELQRAQDVLVNDCGR